MNFTELDEWQGLTAEMVREWLKRTGWELRTDEWGEQRWFNGNGRSIANARVLVIDGFRWIASQSDQTVQALLREINPRMRKGMPSRAALEAHGENGDWVVFRNALHAVRFVWTVCDVVQMVSGFDVFPSDNPEDAAMIAECSFWPCDEHGNKIRWPTDAQGNML